MSLEMDRWVISFEGTEMPASGEPRYITSSPISKVKQ